MHPPVTTEFATTDPEQAHAIVAAAYAENRLRVSGDHQNFRLEQAQHDLGEVTFSTVRSTLDTEYAMDALGRVTICRMVEGAMRIRTQHTDRQFGPGDVLLIAQPEHDYVAFMENFRVATVALDLSLLNRVTDSDDPNPEHRLRLDTLTPEQARHWRRTVDHLGRTLLTGDGTATSPLVLGAAGQLLAATALTAFGDEPDAAPRDRADALPVTVRHAVAFLEGNPDLDIGVADIARAAHVSVRALQLAFRRHLGTTPMRHLRRVRMDLARADLTSAAPGDGTTVTNTALRWGYLNLSRFAADYRAAYGEHPHVTLKRRQS